MMTDSAGRGEPLVHPTIQSQNEPFLHELRLKSYWIFVQSHMEILRAYLELASISGPMTAIFLNYEDFL